MQIIPSQGGRQLSSGHETLQFHNYFTCSRSSLANNTDYTSPLKHVELFVCDFAVKLMAAKCVPLQNTVLSVLLSGGGCNDWENLTLSQRLDGGGGAGWVAPAFALVGIILTRAYHPDHPYFNPFR